MLFHITTEAEWQLARAQGAHRASLDREGFIHLSTERQWLAVANRLFAGRTDLLLLVIDEARLRPEVRYERVDGDDYPHLFGALEVDAIIAAHALLVDASGAICAPAALFPPARRRDTERA